METTRQLKFASLIKREMGSILFEEGANFYGKAFVSITHIMVSPDLGYCKLYLSVMSVPDRQKVIDALNKHQGEVRHSLGKKVRHQIRHIPQLKFFLDDSYDQVEKIEKLFKEIGPIPPASPEGE